eukprot:8463126-Pyramimonas_sp.AAC.1
MTDRLIEHWAPIFKSKPIDLCQAQAYIEQHVPLLDFTRVDPPSPALLRRVVNKMHYSEPGLGSIPHSAWAATDSGASVLSDGMMWIMQGQTLLKSPNDTLQVWLPKGEE